MLDELLIIALWIFLDLWTISSMLAVGMSLTVREIIDPLRERRPLILALLASFVLVPLLAEGLTFLFPLGDDQKTAVILLGACAGGPFIPQLVRMAKGNIPLAVGDMALFLIITIFYVPLVLPLMLYYVQVDALTIARDLFLFLLLPLIIGLLIKWRFSNAAERWHPRFARIATLSLIAMLLVGIIPAVPRVTSVIGTWLIPAAIVLAVGGVLIGYGLSLRLQPGKRKVLTLGTGQRNLAAAFLVASSSFGPSTFVMTIIAAITLTVVVHLIAAQWGRHAGTEIR